MRRRGTGGRRAAAHRWDALFSAVEPRDGLLDLNAPAGQADETPPVPLAETAAQQGAVPGSSDEGSGPALPERPSHPTRPRLALSLRLGAVVGALLTAVCLSWWGIANGSPPAAVSVDALEPSPGASPRAASASGPSPAESSAGGPTVHVVGAVVSPGVYQLALGARVHEAIAAAGGAAPDADVDRLNLAASVQDGVRLRVPRRGEPVEPQAAPAGGEGAAGEAVAGASDGGATPGGGGGGASGKAAAGRKVNINTATAEDLGTLPRVGPVLAQRIVEYRAAHGRFSAPEDLDAVSGIGPKMLESLLPLVTVG